MYFIFQAAVLIPDTIHFYKIVWICNLFHWFAQYSSTIHRQKNRTQYSPIEVPPEEPYTIFTYWRATGRTVHNIHLPAFHRKNRIYTIFTLWDELARREPFLLPGKLLRCLTIIVGVQRGIAE